MVRAAWEHRTLSSAAAIAAWQRAIFWARFPAAASFTTVRVVASVSPTGGPLPDETVRRRRGFAILALVPPWAVLKALAAYRARSPLRATCGPPRSHLQPASRGGA